jgi:predicted nucleotidyltransferase
MMHPDPDQLARDAAIDFACRLVRPWQDALGTELLGVYLIGSLAHAGFSRRYSDIDLALVTGAGLTPPVLDRMRRDAISLSAEWGPKVSVFWTDRHFSLGRFPPLDRVDYLDHAVALMERECVRPARPTLEDIRHYLRGAPFAAWAERARSFVTAQTLESKDHKAYLRTLLYPGRFCYSWLTGRIGSNDDAVAFLSEGQVAGLDIGLLEGALRCRRSAADPDALFSARSGLPSQIDACAALVSGDCSARAVS